MRTLSTPRRPTRRSPLLPATYLAVGVLSALGGLRPTGLAGADALILGAGGLALAACAVRSRTLPLYVAAGAAALCQPATLPLVVGCIAVGAAAARGLGLQRSVASAVAGGLAWAAAVGAPGEPGARPIVVPLVAFAWVALSARRHGSRRFRNRFAIAVVTVALLGVGMTALGALAALDARAHVDRGADLLTAGLAAARAGDTDAAVGQLRGARRALTDAEARLGAAWARPAWVVPGVGQNARALHRIVAEVGDIARAGERAAGEADVESLRVTGGRIDLAAVSSMEAPLSALAAQLDAADVALAALADQWLAPPVEDRLAEARAELADARPSVQLALDGVRRAPGLLGAGGTRTYLVLFTTPVEARARTGFPGNFAEVTFTDGRFAMTRFGRISELNDALPEAPDVDLADEVVRRYGRFEPATEWRSISFSPDFPTVADLARQLYPQSGGTAIDGVVSVDPSGLAALLRFTGPITVPGVAAPLGPDNAAPFLLRDQYIELPDNPDRVDVLEQLAEVAFERLASADLPGPSELGDILGPPVERGNLQLASFRDGDSGFLDRLGISGRLPEVRGDFVAVTTSNVAMNKIDLFLQRSLDYQVRWDPSSGALHATATITLTNEAPPDGLPDYILDNNVGGNRPGGVDMPRGWNNVFVTLYSPWLPDAATIDGAPLALEVLPELGRQAISTFVELPPGATRTIVVELQGQLAARAYALDLAAQPLVQPEEASVAVRVAGLQDATTTGPVRAESGEARGTFLLEAPTRITVREG